MTEFRHYVLTRFNVGLYNGAAKLRVSPPEWMEHRLRLFAGITVPSLMGQSCRDFTWLVLMDRQTPEHYLRKLEGLGCPGLRLIYPVPGQDPWLQGFTPGRYDLITTRIDNDDAFHRDTIGTIQETWRAEHSRHAKPWVIAFPFGLIMDLASRQAWVMEYRRNNCPTLVEDAQNARTIWQWDHSQIPPEVDRCCITDKPYWLQVVHAQNVRNALRSDNPGRIVHEELPARPEHLRHFNIAPANLPA